MQADLELARRKMLSAIDEFDLALREAISAYPTPISGCDEQFNHLLAERKRVSLARGALSERVN